MTRLFFVFSRWCLPMPDIKNGCLLVRVIYDLGYFFTDRLQKNGKKWKQHYKKITGLRRFPIV